MIKLATVMNMVFCFSGVMVCLLVNGCASSMEQARLSYRSMAGYDAQQVTDASSGWVPVHRSSDELTLKTPQAADAALQVTHYLKVWWHPVWKFVLVQNNYRTRRSITVSKHIRSNVQFTRHINGIVGQSVYLIDLEQQRGMVNYNVYYELPPLRVMNFTPEPGGIYLYPDPEDFFSDMDVQPLLFRELSYAVMGFGYDKVGTLKHQDSWFSLGSGAKQWQPFLEAATLNGSDREKWAHWNARDFFVKRLQIHLPGCYVAANSIELVGMGSQDIREQLLLSNDSGVFSRSKAPLPLVTQTGLAELRENGRATGKQLPGSAPESARLFYRVFELLLLKRQ